MTPKTKAILQALPLPRDEFVRRYGGRVLQGLSITGTVRVVGSEVRLGPLGEDRLKS